MSLMNTMRTMKSMSVCEDAIYDTSPLTAADGSASSINICTSYCSSGNCNNNRDSLGGGGELSTGGGGVLGGVFAGIRDTMSNSTTIAEATPRNVAILKGPISNSIGNLNSNNQSAGVGVSSSCKIGDNGPKSIDIIDGKENNRFLKNTHSISNSIGNCINNVTHASNRMNINSNSSSDQLMSKSFTPTQGSALNFNSGCGSKSNTYSGRKLDIRKCTTAVTKIAPGSDSTHNKADNNGSTCSSGASSPDNGPPITNMLHFTSDHATSAMKAMNQLRGSKQVRV